MLQFLPPAPIRTAWEHEPANSEDAVVQQALVDGELHKKLLDELDTGIYIVDRERRILYWNGGAERITGYLAHEVAGQYCHGDLLMHCDEAGGVLCGTRCPLKSVIDDGKPRECTGFPAPPARTPDSGAGACESHTRAKRERSSERLRCSMKCRRQARQVVWRLPNFGCLDELTGAANRRYGEMRVRHAMEGLT